MVERPERIELTARSGVTCLALDVKDYRERHGISQSVLAEIVGISRNEVSNIERRKVVPRFDTALKLMMVLAYDFQVETLRDQVHFKDELSFVYVPGKGLDFHVFAFIVGKALGRDINPLFVDNTFVRRMPDGTALVEEEQQRGNIHAMVWRPGFSFIERTLYAAQPGRSLTAARLLAIS